MREWSASVDLSIPSRIMLCKLYIDEYCYLEGMIECDDPVCGDLQCRGIGPFKLKYLDYWEWFWEGK